MEPVPYPQYLELKDRTIFHNDICHNKVRPNLDNKNLTNEIKSFLNQMWHEKPHKRPDFVNIMSDIKQLIIDTCLHEDAARNFWINSFDDKLDVKFQNFLESFKTYFKLTEQNIFLDFFDEKDIELQSSCLEEILCNDKEHKLISINQFGAIVEWYGPLKISKDDNLLKRILLFCKSPWFHCDMEREGAIDLLKKKKKKHFLVRLNHKSDIRKMHPMTLSYSYNSETHHTRILYVQEEESDKKKYTKYL